MIISSKDPLELVRKFYEQKANSLWVEFKGKNKACLSLYVRKNPIFTIANMSITHKNKMGKGTLTEFLDILECEYAVKIENVINPRLHGYFLRRGYVPESDDPWNTGVMSYIKF